MYNDFIHFVREIYGKDRVSLHEPVFNGNEINYVVDCINSTFVSTVGEYVGKFEIEIAKFTQSKFAIATTNGTSALHLALVAAGVKPSDEVITQNITFIATVNAISYCFATPILIDCDRDNLALSPEKLDSFLEQNAELRGEDCFNRKTGKKISACIVMHVFGHPAKIEQINNICRKWHIKIIEDAAESLGSYYKDQHTGTFSDFGTLSFNGNKILTTGGGGMVITNDSDSAKYLKHLSTTARVAHQWEFIHDEVGYNYRLPNLNAALGVAQIERLPMFLANKRETALKYENFCSLHQMSFLKEDKFSKANYWLNALILKDRSERDRFLAETNNHGIMTRPLWSLISDLDIYKHAIRGNMENSEYFRDRLVNIPSGVRA